MLTPRSAGFVSTSGDGRILDWSRAYAQTWCRRSDADLAGRRAAEVVVPRLADPRPYLRALEEEARHPTRPHATELRHEDGRTLRRISLPRAADPGIGRFVLYVDLTREEGRPQLLLAVPPVRSLGLDDASRAALLHHLSSPGTVISANLDVAEEALAADPPDVDEARASLHDARAAARRLKLVLNGLRRMRPRSRS